jgi:hypothetical protein
LASAEYDGDIAFAVMQQALDKLKKHRAINPAYAKSGRTTA